MRNAVKDSLLLPNSVIVILGLELPQFDVTSFLASGASFYAANRAVARFFVTGEGIIAIAKGASSVGAKIFKFGGYETLFHHLSRDVSPKNRPRISVKRQVCSVSC